MPFRHSKWDSVVNKRLKVFVVAVARRWQDLGYMIMYVTARPDMQKQRVVTWLAQHNFPHGLVWFSDGLVHDPLKQKTILLRHLKLEVSGWNLEKVTLQRLK